MPPKNGVLKNLLVKLLNEGHALIWTITGTALVLITLSGSVQILALKISLVALSLHLLGVLVKKEKTNE